MSKSSFVYFVKPTDAAGPIKIGCSVYPPHRLSALQLWSPVELEVVCTIAGTRSVENAIHQQFAKSRIRGEWFEATTELQQLIARLLAGDPIDQLVHSTPAASRLPSRPQKINPIAKQVGVYKQRVDAARRYASGLRGKVVELPEDVASILRTNGGYRQEYRPLTLREKMLLDSFILDCRDRNWASRQVAA